MDGRRFDSLARALAGAASRRAAVAGIFAALLPLAGRANPARTGKNGRGPADEACLANGRRCGKGSGKRGKPCRKCCSRYSTVQRNGRRRCACKPEGIVAGNASQCCSGQRMANGMCGACAAGFGDCPAGCVDLRTDVRNCGACGVSCAAGEICLNGACTGCGGAGQRC